MTFTEQKDGNVLVIGLNGMIGLEGTMMLDKKISEVLDSGEKCLLLDFAGVTYINSAGLCALILAGKRLARAGGKLVLAGVSGPIQKIFKISGLSTFFAIHPTKAEGLASFS